MTLCESWHGKNKATKTQLQSLLCKLLYVSKSVQPARLFVNRMLAVLRAAQGTHSTLTQDFHKDLNWFRQSLADFNGIVVFPELQPIAGHIYVDSRLFAFGGVFGREAYHLTLPSHLQDQNI